MKKYSFFILIGFFLSSCLHAEELLPKDYLKVHLEAENWELAGDGTSIERWHNAIGEQMEAVAAKGHAPKIAYEEYTSHTVSFGEKHYMECKGASDLMTNKSFTFFFAGKVNKIKTKLNLFGNYVMDNTGVKGLSFSIKPNYEILMFVGDGHAKPLNIKLGTFQKDEFFFFAFSMDEKGNYAYFDNYNKTIRRGVSKSLVRMVSSTENFLFNAYYSANKMRKITGGFSMAEFMFYDKKISDTNFENLLKWAKQKHASIDYSGFGIKNILPENQCQLGTNEPITLEFDEELSPNNTALPKVMENYQEKKGRWKLSADNPSQLVFHPTSPWQEGKYVEVQVDASIRSRTGLSFGKLRKKTFGFIVQRSTDYGLTYVQKDTLVIRDGKHIIPICLILPKDRKKKVPIYFWVHGGGWSGGTPTKSELSMGKPHAEYLAQTLGIATVGVSYRTRGSNGSISKAMADIDAAYRWVKEHADQYQLDVKKIAFGGGSAGGPLSALAAVNYADVDLYLGFNGIFDFVDIGKGGFGGGTNYGQNIPSLAQNSAFRRVQEKGVNVPKAIFFHGSHDTTIDPEQSIKFSDAIIKKGGASQVYIYEGEHHAFYQPKNIYFENVLSRMADFFIQNDFN